MFRRILLMFVGIASFLLCTIPAAIDADDSSSVSIVLPPNIQSETVQISYFLVGAFGGYGGYTEQRFGATSYEISTVVAGKAATEIRAIVYASGCEVQEFVVPLTPESHVSQEFTCQPAQRVELSGLIVPNELARYANAELVIKYTAGWTHSFFGIKDGPVTQFQLARVRPQSDGRFEINLPVVEQEPTHLARSSLCLMLRDSHTFNPIAFNLEPEEANLRSGDRCLQGRAAYPANITFTTAHFEKSALRGKVFRSDAGESISDSYISLVREDEQPTSFDTRTDEAGNYIFGPFPSVTTQSRSTLGFRKGRKCRARIPRNKSPRTVVTSRSNGSGRAMHLWKS